MKEKTLENIGLSKNESAVYNALLVTGEMIASEISKQTELTRTNTYAVLKKLQDKGLISEVKRYKKLTYQVEHPSKLLAYLEERENAVKENKKNIESLLPEIISDYNLINNKPGISFYEGSSGIKKFFEDILREEPKDLFVLSPTHGNKPLKNYLRGHINKQAKLGTKVHLISPSIVTVKKALLDKNLNRERKYIPEELFDTHTQIYIYNNKVSFISLKGIPMGVLIDNPHISKSMKTIFNLIWISKIGKKVT